jgi:AcrR family transcriptional regulator
MTREEILEAAAQIFSQKGYHGTSMQDIAIAVNLQKASLYHHISSKQEILFAILNEALDLLIQRITHVASEPAAPEVKLRKAMCVYLETLAEYQDLAGVLLLEHRSLEPEYQSQHFPKRDAFERIWRDMIQEGIDQGVFTSAHPSLTARAILGVMNWTITWYRRDGVLTAQEISVQFADLFLHGLDARNGTLR